MYIWLKNIPENRKRIYKYSLLYIQRFYNYWKEYSLTSKILKIEKYFLNDYLRQEFNIKKSCP